MKIKIGKRASRQAERASNWWHENRSAAPQLFERELEEALGVLVTRPTAGVSFPTEKRPELRRLLLPKTEYHLYFALECEHNEAVVVIHSVWGARRERGPRL
jgi:plasmid stabilization system protein ParE